MSNITKLNKRSTSAALTEKSIKDEYLKEKALKRRTILLQQNSKNIRSVELISNKIKNTLQE